MRDWHARPDAKARRSRLLIPYHCHAFDVRVTGRRAIPPGVRETNVPKLSFRKGAGPREVALACGVIPGSRERLSIDTIAGHTVCSRTAARYYARALGQPALAREGSLEDLARLYHSDAAVAAYRDDAWPRRAPGTPEPDDDADDDAAPAPVPVPAPAQAPAGSLEAILAGIVDARVAQAFAARPAIDREEVARIARDAALVTRVELVTPGGDVKPLEGHHHRSFPDLLKLVSLRVHPYLYGPAGSGKSTAARNVAKALSLPFGSTGKVDSKYDLLGFRDAHGRTVRTPFREVWEHGGVFLLDELDRSDSAAVVALNNGLATGALDFADGTVDRHSDCVIIGGGNTTMRGGTSTYGAAQAQDGSVLDRFAFLDWGYDEGLERLIAGDDAWVSYVQNVRRAVGAVKVSLIVSPRASIEGAKLLRAGFPREQVENMVVWKGLDAPAVAKVRANLEGKG